MTSEHLIAEAERAIRLGEAVLAELHLGDLELARGWADLLGDRDRLLHNMLAEQAPHSAFDRVGLGDPTGPFHVVGMVKEVLARLTTEQVGGWRAGRCPQPMRSRLATSGPPTERTNSDSWSATCS